mmetsp:Transcript_4954/g.6324  ORF Transcript_4954/g.6324 Transcript_4954/m.6324 type:complete len:158 (-) Transcript_4954:127-600(-)|eukprot:CAMPEP_0114340944 /NCGR_PEP_ID=MMETSP0101-20121206/8709_1 /TAXON_ID=38822 ORGANISM="Pteridomonas danica, Strain PT" /NCGR_SAMPLE_ID=MMETSP0101 /ASSEMBLY_ACC=CAM_ASM_000211 /LENGTH=157 /DNA_ID=CAMNT_0001474365 /DNA_START=89 /DNA_END=562 /DNA_ORIENTATION=+
MRRQASGNSVTALIEEDPPLQAKTVETQGQELENGIDCDLNEDIDGPIPVRKGTLSKDLPKGMVNYTMAGVMAKAQQLGVLLALTPPIVFVAYWTGNLHLFSGVVACITAIASVFLLIYKLLNQRQEKESGVVMMGFALYITAPLCGLSATAYYLNL